MKKKFVNEKKVLNSLCLNVHYVQKSFLANQN